MTDSSNEKTASPWERLRDFTSARVALGRAGSGLPTEALLRFRHDHALARDAVYSCLDTARLHAELQALGLSTLALHSAAADRRVYLQRPDLGRAPDAASLATLAENEAGYGVVFILADGLSATAVNRHALPLLALVLPEARRLHGPIAPIAVVGQGRVAIGDSIGEPLSAEIAVVLIGERPGLSAPDSLGIYLTWRPRIGVTDAERNCISNVHMGGLSYETAASRLLYLLHESRRRKLSGVALKEDAPRTLL